MKWFVAMEFTADNHAELFSRTPQLESLYALLSTVTSAERNLETQFGKARKQDLELHTAISRKYLHSKARAPPVRIHNAD